jgi:proteasome lid subunit RPN8/RPN11
MQLTHDQLKQLIALARADAPQETCGIIGGKDGRALQIYPLKNVDDQPQVRYLGDPQQQLHALQEIDEKGWDVLAIYHSHPATQAYPSQTDIGRAFYPDAIYMLISLMNPEQATVRAYTIHEGQVGEITLEIEDEALEIEDEANESPRENTRRTAQSTRRPRAGRAVAALSKRRPASGGTRRPRGRVSKKI